MIGITCIIFVVLCSGQYVSSVPNRNLKDLLTVNNCGKSLILPEGLDRIVGGGYVKHGMYPWMVSLYEETDTFKHACGATILNERWIVTAAHCIDFPDEPWKYEIYAGMHKLSQEDGPTVQHYTISELHIHENYGRYTHANDIALLKTSKPINFEGSSGYINGVCLPSNNEDPEGLAVVTGWGHEYSRGYNSDILKHVTIPLVDRKKCNVAYEDRIQEMMICGGSENKDTCQNDSGGPLIQIDSNGISTLVGVTSFGRGCGIDGYPGVYTKVSHFRDWMEKKINA